MVKVGIGEGKGVRVPRKVVKTAILGRTYWYYKYVVRYIYEVWI